MTPARLKAVNAELHKLLADPDNPQAILLAELLNHYTLAKMRQHQHIAAAILQMTRPTTEPSR